MADNDDLLDYEDEEQAEQPAVDGAADGAQRNQIKSNGFLLLYPKNGITIVEVYNLRHKRNNTYLHNFRV